MHTTLGEADYRRVFWSWGLGKILKRMRRKSYKKIHGTRQRRLTATPSWKYIQHHGPEKVECIDHAVNPAWLLPRSKQLKIWNWEISDFGVFKTTGNSVWEDTFWAVIQLGIPSLKLRASFYSSDLKITDVMIQSCFFRVPSCLESPINTENARLWW